MDARSSYREAAVRGATPVRLVICLYEQVIEDLRGAIVALEKGDIAARTRGINHALLVIGQLQGSLDRERGGEVARNLDLFYNHLRSGLVDAQIKQSAKILEQQVSQLVMVYEAWLEVERIAAGTAPLAAETLSPAASNMASASPVAGWNA